MSHTERERKTEGGNTFYGCVMWHSDRSCAIENQKQERSPWPDFRLFFLTSLHLKNHIISNISVTLPRCCCGIISEETDPWFLPQIECIQAVLFKHFWDIIVKLSGDWLLKKMHTFSFEMKTSGRFKISARRAEKLRIWERKDFFVMETMMMVLSIILSVIYLLPYKKILIFEN